MLLGSATWQDPRHDFKLSLIEEAAAMVTMGVPIRFAVKYLSLTPEELSELLIMLAEDKEEAEQKEQEQLEAEAENAAATAAKPVTSTSSSPSDS
jgi:hypothetical protein